MTGLLQRLENESDRTLQIMQHKRAKPDSNAFLDLSEKKVQKHGKNLPHSTRLSPRRKGLLQTKIKGVFTCSTFTKQLKISSMTAITL